MKILSTLFLILTVFQLSAQYSPVIRTGRPGQSIGAFTVGKHVLQFQQGIEYSSLKRNVWLISNSGNSTGFFRDNRISQDNVIRFGISRKFEISSVITYNWIQSGFDLKEQIDPSLTFPKKANEFHALDLGGRYNILEGKGKGPVWCVQGRVGLRDMVNGLNFIQFKLLTALQQKLNDKTNLTANIGYIYSSNSTDQINYTLNYSWSFSERAGVFLENYGYFHQNSLISQYRLQTFFDSGIWYLINNDIQLDLLSGFGINEWLENPQKTWFIGAGISWRSKFS